MAVSQGPQEEKPTQEQLKPLPTPVISPLPLPQINPLLRNLVAGSPGAVNPVIAQAQQIIQQSFTALNTVQIPAPNAQDPFQTLRNVTAGSPGAVNAAGVPISQQFANLNPAIRAQPPQAAGPGLARDPTTGRFGGPPTQLLGGTAAQLLQRAFGSPDVPPGTQLDQPLTELQQQRIQELSGRDRPPRVTTPQSPFALNAGEFHRVMQWTSGRILQAVDAGSRSFLPGEITDVIAALLPWRDWGFDSYQDALRALGYTEIPGAGTWIKDEEITSGTAGGGGGGTNTQVATQRAGFGGGGGGLRSPQFSTLINWRI